MSERLPSLTPRQVLSALERAGFLIHHTTGSHHYLKHPTKPGHRVSIAYHLEDLKRGTLRSIIRQAGMTPEQFLKLL
jgi:predicted RNA binding protein YcfA (HicA-like mRNA interferase family)